MITGSEKKNYLWKDKLVWLYNCNAPPIFIVKKKKTKVKFKIERDR